jgi:hypothetical protein
MRAIPWSARRLRSSRWLPPTSTVGQLSGGLCCQRQSAAGCPELQPALANQRWPQRPCGFDIASHDQRPCELSIHTLEQRRAEELQAQVRCRRVGGDDGVLCERRRRVKSGPAMAGGERQRAAHSIELARYSEQQPEHKCEQQQQRHSGERFQHLRARSRGHHKTSG